MPAELLTFLPGNRDAALARCRDIIRAGGVIAFPTDTVYGLGADPGNRGAVERIFTIKGREADQPILILLHDRSAVTLWAASVSREAETLMERFWPGPLTLLFPAKDTVPPALTAGTGRIGLRVPGSDLTRALIAAAGGALTGTSANRSGGANLLDADDVLRELGDRVDLVLDGGRASGDRPSTIVDVSSGPPRLIREGLLSEKALFA